MKTKPGKNKINIITLGCSKNAYDSEVLMGQLKANNISFDIFCQYITLFISNDIVNNYFNSNMRK